MAFDSLGILAACALFCACVSAWLLAAPLRPAARLYLRFASMLFAALGWDQYKGKGEVIGEYFPSSGTGQVNVVFPVM